MKLTTTLAITAIAASTALPMTSFAQSRGNDRGSNNRNYNDRNRGNAYGHQQQQRRSNDRDWNRSSRYDDHRQDTKNEWRNIAIGSGALGLLGLLTRDNTLTFAGTAGALYSANRYEQDRKSQNSYDRARASYFSRDHFDRDGVRFNRISVNRNGQRYYQFVRGR